MPSNSAAEIADVYFLFMVVDDKTDWALVIVAFAELIVVLISFWILLGIEFDVHGHPAPSVSKVFILSHK